MPIPQPNPFNQDEQSPDAAYSLPDTAIGGLQQGTPPITPAWMQAHPAQIAANKAADAALPSSATPPPLDLKTKQIALETAFSKGQITKDTFDNAMRSLSQPAATAPPAAAPVASITAPPKAAPAAGQPNASSDADILKAALQGSNGSVHPLGMSKADQAYARGLSAQADDLNSTYKTAIDQSKDAVSGFKANSEALADDSRLGVLMFQQKQEEEGKKRQALADKMHESQAKVESKLDELEAQGVNPNHYWNSLETGQKIGLVIAAGLTGFGQALSHNGGPNSVVQQINTNIDRDIDAQKSNLNKQMTILQKKYDFSKNGFDSDMAMLHAEAESTQTAYTIAQKDIDRRASMYKDNADVQQRAAQISSGLADSRNTKLGGIMEKQYLLSKRAETPVGGGGDTLARLQKAVAIRKALQELQGDDPETQQKRLGLEKTLAEINALNAKTSGKGKVDLQGLGNEVTGTSTNWEPQRGIQGTDAFKHKLVHERWNSQILAAVHQANPAAKGLEALKAIGAAYLINDGDSDATIEQKQANARRDLGGAVAPDTNPAGLSSDDEEK